MIHFIRNLADKGGYKAVGVIKDLFPYTPSLDRLAKSEMQCRLGEDLY